MADFSLRLAPNMLPEEGTAKQWMVRRLHPTLSQPLSVQHLRFHAPILRIVLVEPK